MRARLCLLPFVAALAAVPATASAKGFSSGVSSAEVRSTSALVWTRADEPGRVTLEVATNRRFRHPILRRELRAKESADNTVQTRVRGLTPVSHYWFRFKRGGARSDRGTFETAPGRKATRAVRFAWTGDSDPVLDPGTDRLHFRPFDVYARMRRERNDFNVNLGDTIYSDTDSDLANVDPLALTVDEKRAKYRTMLTATTLRRLRAAAGMYNQWDDHEFLNDFAIDQREYPTVSGTQPGQAGRMITVDGQAVYEAGVRAFREYMPVSFSRSRGIYRSFRWGK